MCSLTVGVYSAVYLDVHAPLFLSSLFLSLCALGQLCAVGVCVAV